METRVIIVEDEGLIALHISEMLAHAGFTSSEFFCSGEDTLGHLEHSPPPDIVLMDIGLAGRLNGIETARRIREHADIPVIFLTAFSDRDHLRRAAEVSPYGYLVKPVTEGELVAAIQSALCRKDQKT